MPIRPVTCPACHSALETPAGASVARLRCPRCNVRLAFSLGGTSLVAPPDSSSGSAPQREWHPARAILPLAVIAAAVLWFQVGPRWRPRPGEPAPEVVAPTVPALPKAQVDALSGLALGEALFHREWAPNDPVCASGDGLGPVYNARSCVACHFAGGSGGAGSNSRNVDLLTSTLSGRLAHPLFREATTVVLHRHGLDPGYKQWRAGMLGGADALDGTEVAAFFTDDAASLDLRTCRTCSSAAVQQKLAVGPKIQAIATRAQRNSTALFGAGLIDAIPESILEAAARARFARFPEVHGRVSRLEAGKVGRFGWKAQQASLEEFVLTACAIELGLEVPGHHQGHSPQRSAGDHAPGLDLTERQCDALVAYVRSLPGPELLAAVQPSEVRDRRLGETLFHQVGCATCHVPNLGQVQGIYSDLLLHDLGEDSSDTASFYGVDSPALAAARADGSLSGRTPGRPLAGATAREWRTPPLWGIRDSAPYLHDGRATTLAQAIGLHGGEAERSARLFFQLTARQQQQLMAFLQAQIAPRPDAPMAVAVAELKDPDGQPPGVINSGSE